MSSLWLGIGLLSLLAVSFIVIPFLRFRGGNTHSEAAQRSQKNTGLFEQRMRELDLEVAAGSIEPVEAESVRTELQRSFLDDMKGLETETGSTADTSRSLTRLLPILAAVLVPLAALWLYMGWGAQPDLVLPGLIADIRQSETPEQETEALEILAEALQARYERREDDTQNAYTLATLYLRTEQFEKAAEVFLSLVEEMESPLDQATILGQLAQTQYLNAQETMTAEVESTIGRALSLNPNEKTVMSILAVEAFLEQDFNGALGYWRRQLSQLAPGSQDHVILSRRINLIETELGIEETDETSEAVASVSVTVNVDVNDDLRAQTTGDTRVFVYARNPDSPMPMPVAARDYTVADLPLTVTLDDSTPMMEGMPTLSTASRIIIGARISHSGVANRASGDFETVLEPFELNGHHQVTLEISEIVP